MAARISDYQRNPDNFSMTFCMGVFVSSSGRSHATSSLILSDAWAAHGRIATFPFYMQIRTTNANDYDDVDDYGIAATSLDAIRIS